MFSEASLIFPWNQFRFWMVGVQILQQVRLECYHKGKVSGIPIGNFYSMLWPAMRSNKGFRRFRAVKGVRTAAQHKLRDSESGFGTGSPGIWNVLQTVDSEHLGIFLDPSQAFYDWVCNLVRFPAICWGVTHENDISFRTHGVLMNCCILKLKCNWRCCRPGFDQRESKSHIFHLGNSSRSVTPSEWVVFFPGRLLPSRFWPLNSDPTLQKDQFTIFRGSEICGSDLQ